MGERIAETFVKMNEETVADLNRTAALRSRLQQEKHEANALDHSFYDLQNTKKKAHLVKWRATENLERYLLDFESSFTKSGGHVIWANDSSEALQEIEKILAKHDLNTINRPHDMVLEEIGLDKFARENSVNLSTFDLAKHVLSLRGDSPSHFDTPTIHLSSEDILALLPTEGGEQSEDKATQAETQMSLLREQLRAQGRGESFAFISGADYLVADTGSVGLQDNEGHQRLAGALAKVHIAVAGINTVIPSVNDLDYLWPLYATHAHLQPLCTNHTLWHGPRRSTEIDGPENMYVILLDNGRSNLLAQKEQRQGLYCMQCGSCLRACNYYQLIGSENYQTTYFGPIGALNTPHLKSSDEYPHFSHASGLQIASKKVCPANIDLERLLHLNRRDEILLRKKPTSEKTLWTRFLWFMNSRKRLDFFGAKWKGFLLELSLKKYWGHRKVFPKPAAKSFAQQWKEKQKREGTTDHNK